MSPLIHGGWMRLLKTGPVVIAVVVATTAATTAVRPAIARDFPDPAVLAVGSTYYAYSTASTYGKQVRHVPVQRATTLNGTWTDVGDAMPTLPTWVADNAAGSVWAPEVAARSDGSYILYFTARAANKNVQCIGVALARSPKGPFQAQGDAPLVCRPQDVDSIDPSAFTDSDGKQYLLYTSGRGSATIWMQQVSVDGITPIGDRHALIRSDRPDEANIVEAPAMVKHGDKYVLFYSGNAFNSGKYFVNYATSTSLSSTFAKHAGQFLNRDSLGGAFTNPGGEEVVPGRAHDYLLFHAYTSPTQRSMFAVGLTWTSQDEPTVDLNTLARAPVPTKP